jgi:hypothetical protein
MRVSLLALAVCSAAAAASAQVAPTDPDWKEIDAPPPPALRTTGLIPLDVAGPTSLRFGIDPASVTVGRDSIVRYVVVATSASGTINAMYEGIRCDSGDVKVYARHSRDNGWVPSRGAQWQSLQSTPNSRHSLAIARSGACLGQSPNGSAAQIVQDLRAPIDRRFERGGVNR